MNFSFIEWYKMLSCSPCVAREIKDVQFLPIDQVLNFLHRSQLSRSQVILARNGLRVITGIAIPFFQCLLRLFLCSYCRPRSPAWGVNWVHIRSAWSRGLWRPASPKHPGTSRGSSRDHNRTTQKPVEFSFWFVEDFAKLLPLPRQTLHVWLQCKAPNPTL